jgi:hypothetical protein
MALFRRFRGPRGAFSGSASVAGRPAAGQVLRFEPPGGGSGFSTTIRPDATFNVSLSAGTFRVRLSWGSLRFPEETLFEAGSVTLEPGESKALSLEIPAGALDGKIRKEPGGPGAAEVTVRVEISSAEGLAGAATRVSASDGTFRVKPCPVGKARVIVEGVSLAEVSVSAGGTAKVEAALASPSPAAPA